MRFSLCLLWIIMLPPSTSSLLLRGEGRSVVGGWEVFPLIDFLCLRSDALGSAIKQIIIWDFGTLLLLLLLLFFFHCISLVFHLFPGSEKKNIFSTTKGTGPAGWRLSVWWGPAQEGSRRQALSNPSAVSQEESLMKAGFPSRALDVSFSCRVDF